MLDDSLDKKITPIEIHFIISFLLDPHNIEVLSLSSSGVGTTSGSHSGSAGSSSLTPTGEMTNNVNGQQRHQSSPGQRGLIMPGMHVVCVESFSPSPHVERGLPISQGEIIEGKMKLRMNMNEST